MPRYLRNLIFGLIVIGVLFGLDFVFQAGIINPYYTRILMLCGISVTLAVSLNLINGFTGQFSIGHAGFMAVGAYSSAYFSVNYGMNLANSMGGGKLGWIVALALSTIVGATMAGIAGLAVGIPSLRLRKSSGKNFGSAPNTT
jgi:branched-chain amino acid transport system permease protein